MDDSSVQADGLLSYQQAAEVLGTAVTFVERLVATRRVAFVRVGHYVRIQRSDLERYIQSARTPAVEE